VRGDKAVKLIKVAFEFGITGIGVQQKGGSRFIHLDDLRLEDGFARPNIWSY
jgi:zinc D-Ala-D-Ala carboxypeptidase